MISSRSPLLRAGLVLALVLTVTCSFLRADPAAVAPATRRHPAARIVSIDLVNDVIVLEIRHARYSFTLNRHAVDRRTHQPINLRKLAIGQLINFVSQPGPSGQLEIMALAIMPADEDDPVAEAADASSGGPQTVNPISDQIEVTPFQ